MTLPTASANHKAVRVAYVVHSFDTGGIERCVSRLVNGLDRNLFKTMIVCMATSGPAEKWIHIPGVRIVELKKKNGNDWRAIRRLADTLRSWTPTIVHSHNWGTLIETLLARRSARTLVHVHAERGTVLGGIAVESWRNRMRSLAMRWALRQVDGVVCNAASVAAQVAERSGVSLDSITLIPNGVEPPTVTRSATTRNEVRRQLGISSSSFVFGSVGRLAPVKGFSTAIHALRHLVRQGVDARLILVGDGPERESLQKQANAIGLGRRFFLPGHSSDPARWVATMDAYVNTSLSEGMSQSIVEAMAAGIPFVVTDVGDSSLLVGGDNPCGFVVPPNDPAAAAAALAKLTSEHYRMILGKNAIDRYVSQYSLERMIAAYESFYLNLMHLKGLYRASAWRLPVPKTCSSAEAKYG